MVKQQTNRDRTFRTIVILAILLVLILAGAWYYWSVKKPETPLTAPPTAVAPPPPAPEPTAAADEPAADAVPQTPSPQAAPPEAPGGVIQFDSDDEELRELMARRKARYGLKDSVDMVVESDETIQVGGISVPMEEILERIRLKSGDLVETDLGPTLSTVSEGERIDRLYTQLKEKEKRFKALEREIESAPAGAPGTQEKLQEYASLRSVMDMYGAYRKALSDIREWELILESQESQPPREALAEHLDRLEAEKIALEQSLSAQLGLQGDPAANRTKLLETLADARARMAEIDAALASPSLDASAGTDLVRERAALSGQMADLEPYESVLDRIDKTRALTERTDAEAASEIASALTDLNAAADTLEDTLTDRLLPDMKTDAYGVYIVRPGDNIWNIHFQFLKENFKYRGITLSPVADEPDARGVSSGVGKILKFAEGMVYIYNLQEQQLEDNIDIIHPLSKIIVFNMARAIELIREIDQEDIKHIQFDGETLWLPAG